MNELFWADFYKFNHIFQYPGDTEFVWSNWTARWTRVPGQTSVRWFGLQHFIKKVLIEDWAKFFWTPRDELLKEYREFVAATLGNPDPRTEHIEYLHKLGHLPLSIWALPEGSEVPLGVPMLVLSNTDPKCFWLPNYLETIMSAYLWKPSTSANTAARFRELFVQHAKAFGEKDLSFVDWQGHDFSERGMSGKDDIVLSGMGHLLSFEGTDTAPALIAARDYYGRKVTLASVNATEHSVMCAGTEEGEFDTFRRLITEVHPTGVLSIVSDTWDLWRVLTDYIPKLKSEILARDGKIVIRPDSGDPVKVVAGDPEAPVGSPAHKGALQLLAEAMGTDGTGHINKAGLIYGDGISPERADAILTAARSKGLSPFNIVFGIGSFSYEYVTRDEYGFVMKATAVQRSRKILIIFKKPVTQDKGFSKASLVGIPIVYRERTKDGQMSFFVKDHGEPRWLDSCAFQKVYQDGKLLIEESFEEIRKRVRS